MAIELDDLSKEQLKELVEIYARNIYALDGVWFQSVEKTDGMDAAMEHDRNAWRRFTANEANSVFIFAFVRAGLAGERLC